MTGCLLYCRIRAFEGGLVEFETAGHGPAPLRGGRRRLDVSWRRHCCRHSAPRPRDDPPSPPGSAVATPTAALSRLRMSTNAQNLADFTPVREQMFGKRWGIAPLPSFDAG